MQQTIWQDTVSPIDLTFDDLHELFNVTVEKPKLSIAKGRSAPAAAVTFLDISKCFMSYSVLSDRTCLARSNNIGIMLKRLKLSPQKIRLAILEVDDEALGFDDLATMGRMLPTPEEVSQFA